MYQFLKKNKKKLSKQYYQLFKLHIITIINVNQ